MCLLCLYLRELLYQFFIRKKFVHMLHLCWEDINTALLMHYANIALIRLLLKDCLIFKDVDLMGINLMIEYCLCSVITGSDAENWNLSSVRKRLDFPVITVDPDAYGVNLLDLYFMISIYI